ncbi:hypothetical protein [Streptomyces sp. NPDC002057]|uniref:hypothetical protein n=1 Tax=Streptomyces sp. NPDC002057 TaxID=3154664 RepID=UPI00331D2BBB
MGRNKPGKPRRPRVPRLHTLREPNPPGAAHEVPLQVRAGGSVCVPDGVWNDVPLDVAGAVLFLRACRSQSETPDPEEYGRHIDVNGPDHARELFAAAEATGYVDEKGCDACPVGDLCTRAETEAG